MVGLFVRFSPLRRGIGLLALMSFASYSQDHSSNFGNGNFGTGTVAASSGQGGKMSPLEFVAATRAINQKYDTDARAQQAAMVQANNEMAGCQLQDIENRNEANQNYGYGADGKVPGQTSPLAAAAQSALPGLMQSGQGMQDVLGNNKENLQKKNEQLKVDYDGQVVSLKNFLTECQVKTTPNVPTLDNEGNVAGSFGTVDSACYGIGRGLSGPERVCGQTPAEAKFQCAQMVSNLRQTAAANSAQMQKNNEASKASGQMIANIGVSLVSGAFSYFTAKSANDQAAEANKLAKQGTAKQYDLARKICDKNAQQAYDLAKSLLADINRDRANALADLGMMASVPGIVNDNSKADTDVPVDGTGTGVVGPQIAVNDASPLSNPDNPLLADNAGSDSASPSSSGGGGGGGPSGGVSPPPSTFGAGPGPDKAGLPISGGAKTGTVSGSGGVIPLGGEGGMAPDPYAGFGMANADQGVEYNRTPASSVIGDGGMLKLLVMARRRYSAHASDLVKSINISDMTKDTKPLALQKASAEKAQPAEPLK